MSVNFSVKKKYDFMNKIPAGIVPIFLYEVYLIFF